jgi:nucleoside-diphosphate-sugar epimerase
VQVRHARFEDPASFESALQGVERFFLVSTPDIARDFGVAMDYDGTKEPADPSAEARGRESHHKNAIDAAVRAGVKYIVYSSLAFGFSSTSKAPADESKAGVMRAHLRTEAYLRSVGARHGVDVTVLREGVYNESWPLYLGYFDVAGADAERDVVPLAGDGKICWTAIHDLGVASALVLSASGSEEEEFKGKTSNLSTRPDKAKTMAEVARLVGEARGRDVRVKVVGREEYVRYYVEERGKPKPAVEWWVSTYEALEDGECLIDDPLLEKLLGRVGLKPIPVEDTIAAMVAGQGN